MALPHAPPSPTRRRDDEAMRVRGSAPSVHTDVYTQLSEGDQSNGCGRCPGRTLLDTTAPVEPWEHYSPLPMVPRHRIPLQGYRQGRGGRKPEALGDRCPARDLSPCIVKNNQGGIPSWHCMTIAGLRACRRTGIGKRPTQPYTHGADGRSNPIVPVKFWNVFKKLRIPLSITGCGYEKGVTRGFEKVGC